MAGLVCGVDIGGTFTDCVLIGDDGRVAYGKSLCSPADDFQSGFFGSHRVGRRPARATHREDLYRRMDPPDLARLDRRHQHRRRAQGRATSACSPPGPRGHDPHHARPRPRDRRAARELLRFTETAQARAARARASASTGRRAGRLRRRRGRRARRGGGRAGRRRPASPPAVERSRSPSSGPSRTPPTSSAPREIVAERAPRTSFVTSRTSSRPRSASTSAPSPPVINAFVGPRTSAATCPSSTARLGELGFGDGLMLMQCHGGMVPLEHGTDRPIMTIGSGPVGGMVGTQRLADDLGRHDIIATDMGGTSFDVGIIKDREPLAADDTLLGKWRYRIPAVEVLSIGAGGGSIAWIDELGGGLRVGPQSASSQPGPGLLRPRRRGADGDRRRPGARLHRPRGGLRHQGRARQIQPRRDLAEQAIKAKVAEPLGLSLTDAALGIVEIVNAKMANAAGERGHRPRLRPARLRRSCPTAAPAPCTPPATPAALGVDTIVVPGEAASVWSRLRHRPVRHPLPVRSLGRPDRALRPGALSRPPSASSRRRPARRWPSARTSRELRVPPLRPHALPVAAPRAGDALPRRRDRRGDAGGGQTPVRRALHRALRRGRRCCPARAVEIVSIRLEPAITMGSEQARPARRRRRARSSARAAARSTSSAAPAPSMPPSTTATRCRSARSSRARR